MGSGGRRDSSEYVKITCEVFYDSTRRKKMELDHRRAMYFQKT